MWVLGRWVVRMRDVHIALLLMCSFICLAASFQRSVSVALLTAFGAGYFLACIPCWSQREMELRAILGSTPFDRPCKSRIAWFWEMGPIVLKHLENLAPSEEDASSFNVYIRARLVFEDFSFACGFQDIKPKKTQLVVIPINRQNTK